MTELGKKEWQAKIDEHMLEWLVQTLLDESGGFITDKNISKGEKLALVSSFSKKGRIIAVSLYTCEKTTINNFATHFNKCYGVRSLAEIKHVNLYQNNLEQIGKLIKNKDGSSYYVSWLVGCNDTFLKMIKNSMMSKKIKNQKSFDDYETTLVGDELLVYEK